MRRTRSGVVTAVIVAAGVAGLSLSAGPALAGPRHRSARISRSTGW